jgi:nitrite reductase (NADH) small subunit
MITIASTKDFEEKSSKIVEHEGKKIAIFKVEENYYALDNTCCHRGGPLGEGSLNGDCVTCPWHNWEFNVKDGSCITNPMGKVKSYPVTKEGEEIKVEIE